MIFVTVGTHHLPFDRLLKWVDSYLRKNTTREKVIVQSGTSLIRVFKAEQKSTYDHDEFMKTMRRARVVISHAGPATIYQSIALAGKKPIVVPRLKKHREHVSNHQLFFSQELHQEKKIILNLSESQFVNSLKNFKLQKNKWSSSTNMASKLQTYLENINFFC